ncbi:lipocalin family protein [Shewanella sp. NIFS-20-20]|nr:lipocalin family protein [Shewanella sp. NIFS-20-20]MBV7314325.1 lipocalin family protein [Shewanella sp. NIFS-20-20]
MLDHEVSVVDNFNSNEYVGLWYEVARLDHRFERGLTNVTAQYIPLIDGIKVINRGFDPQTQQWQQAIGKAKFIDNPNIGLLKVSFFGPFYGAYQIHRLQTNEQDQYDAALIIGPNLDYAWILSRQPAITAQTKQDLISDAGRLGISPDAFIWVTHDK